MKKSRSLSVALIFGGLLLTSTIGFAQQRDRDHERGKAPVVRRAPAPAPVAKARQPVKITRQANRHHASRERMAVRRGAWVGTTLLTLPSYRNHSAFDRLPVEVAVQIELQSYGYYDGPIDGQIGRGSVRAITNYQRSNGLVATGMIDRALLVSLNIID